MRLRFLSSTFLQFSSFSSPRSPRLGALATTSSSLLRMSSQAANDEYVPPKVWKPSEMGGKFGSINQPTSGARHDQVLSKGKHPLQLYSMGTPNGQKVTIFLEECLEKGIKEAEYDAWFISIFDGDQFGSGFVELNPNSKIPALLDTTTNTRMFETGSILLQLAEKFGKVFIPDEKRPEVLNWLFWQMGSAPYIGGGFGHFYAYAPSKMKYPIDRFTMEAKRQLDVLDKQLAKTGKFICGDEFTLADIAIYPWYGLLVKGQIYPEADIFLNAKEDYPNVIRWADEIAKRPGVMRGSMVNKTFGDDKSKQLKERHDASDFEHKTQDKIEAEA